MSGQELEELNKILEHQEEMFEELEREYAYLIQIKAELDTDEVNFSINLSIFNFILLRAGRPKNWVPSQKSLKRWAITIE